ncbi:MAG: PA0069 family radical SAM protein [Paracoccaceae bacterium]
MSDDESTLRPSQRIRARAAGSNRSGRFEPVRKVVEHDGWDIEEDEALVRTEVSIERPRSVITRNTSPDIGFDRSINPYRGCEQGCIYCFARPTHAYLGLSPGLDFETKLIARPDAAKVLRRELSASRYVPQPIAIGTNTDPYQPIEARHRVMRQVLEVLAEFNHPVTVVTKGTLIERDADILGPMGQAGLARVGISVTTLDPALSRLMEPRAPAPARRLAAIRKLSEVGCPVRVMVAPVVPALTDHELEAILGAARDHGAVAASWIMLRLPLEVSTLFRDWLEAHYPDRAARIMARVREMHGGQDFSAEWGKRMKGEGTYAALIARRFEVAVARLRLLRELPALRTDLFAVPGRGRQLSLF